MCFLNLPSDFNFEGLGAFITMHLAGDIEMKNTHITSEEDHPISLHDSIKFGIVVENGIRSAKERFIREAARSEVAHSRQ